MFFKLVYDLQLLVENILICVFRGTSQSKKCETDIKKLQNEE